MAGEGERPPGYLCDRLLVGATGSMAVNTVPQLLIGLRAAGLVGRVDVVMTRPATRFVTPFMMELASGNPVWTDTFQQRGSIRIPHVELTRQADLYLVIPTTASTLSKAACGAGGDLVASAILAAPCPVVLVPSMNEVMWCKRAVQRNVEACREAGYHVVEPAVGYRVAALRHEFGGMPTAPQLLSELRRVLDEG